MGMKKTAGRVRLCVTLLIINLAFIWGNSLLPGELSGIISKWVGQLLQQLFGGDLVETPQGHGLLRKLAHFAEFCTLGMCLTWLMSMLGKRSWSGLRLGFAAACTDELIQCFVPDRGPGIRDVLIDTAGVAVGMAMLLAGYAIYQKQKNKNYTKEKLL